MQHFVSLTSLGKYTSHCKPHAVAFMYNTLSFFRCELTNLIVVVDAVLYKLFSSNLSLVRSPRGADSYPK